MDLIEDAKTMAHEAHDSIEQKRKYTGEPYWTHTDAVAALVESIGGTPEMVAAAHLHDVLEDVTPLNSKYDAILITNTFGEKVATIVKELTDEYTKEKYPDRNRVNRKAWERERIGKISDEAKTIKLADLINNTESIVTNDKEFSTVYLREQLDTLPYLTEGHSALLNQASVQVVAGCAAMGIDIPMIG